MRKLIALIFTSIALFGCKKEFINDVNPMDSNTVKDASVTAKPWDTSLERIPVVLNNELYTLGGYNDDDNKILYKWNEPTKTWNKIASLYWGSSSLKHAIGFKNKLVLVSSKKLGVCSLERGEFVLNFTFDEERYISRNFCFATTHENNYYVFDDNGNVYSGDGNETDLDQMSSSKTYGVFTDIVKLNGRNFAATESGLYETTNFTYWNKVVSPSTEENFLGAFNYNNELVVAHYNIDSSQIFLIKYDSFLKQKDTLASFYQNIYDDSDYYDNSYRYMKFVFQNDFLFLFPGATGRNNKLIQYSAWASDNFSENEIKKVTGPKFGTPKYPLFFDEKLYYLDDSYNSDYDYNYAMLEIGMD